jgi:hypothetical protein
MQGCHVSVREHQLRSGPASRFSLEAWERRLPFPLATTWPGARSQPPLSGQGATEGCACFRARSSKGGIAPAGPPSRRKCPPVVCPGSGWHGTCVRPGPGRPRARPLCSPPSRAAGAVMRFWLTNGGVWRGGGPLGNNRFSPWTLPARSGPLPTRSLPLLIPSGYVYTRFRDCRSRLARSPRRNPACAAPELGPTHGSGVA